MKSAWAIFYAVLWAYRCAYSVVAQVFVAAMTSLGDSDRYQVNNLANLSLLPSSFETFQTTRYIGTVLVEGLGGILAILTGGSQILINIGFQTIGFIGIVYFMRRLDPVERIAAGILVMLPSFSIWSSVAGKEPIIVLATGILAGCVVDLLRREGRITLVHYFALMIVILLREQYMPGIIFLLLGIVVSQRVKQRGFLLMFGGLVSLLILYVLQDVFANLAYELIPHFNVGGSTREAFWGGPEDVMPKLFEGLWLGFFGPRFSEINLGFLQMASFVESAVLVSLLLLFLMRQVFSTPVTMLVLAGFSIFWLLLTTHPMGVMNPGSAVRYRTGYELLVLVCILVVCSRRSYSSWVRPRREATFPISMQNSFSTGIATR